MTSPPPVTRVLETALYVDDLAAARRFYVGVLGASVLLDTPRLLALSVNAQSVAPAFFSAAPRPEPLVTAGGVVPPHGGSGVQHVAFRASRTRR